MTGTGFVHRISPSHISVRAPKGAAVGDTEVKHTSINLLIQYGSGSYWWWCSYPDIGAFHPGR